MFELKEIRPCGSTVCQFVWFPSLFFNIICKKRLTAHFRSRQLLSCLGCCLWWCPQPYLSSFEMICWCLSMPMWNQQNVMFAGLTTTAEKKILDHLCIFTVSVSKYILILRDDSHFIFISVSLGPLHIIYNKKTFIRQGHHCSWWNDSEQKLVECVAQLLRPPSKARCLFVPTTR